MKATGIFPKCRPGTAAPTAGGARAAARAHAAAAPSPLAHAAPMATAAAVSSAAEPLEPLVLHAAPAARRTCCISTRTVPPRWRWPSLLMPEARVTHVPTLAAAREHAAAADFFGGRDRPDLPDGDAAELLPALTAIPLLVYSASQPDWRTRAGAVPAEAVDLAAPAVDHHFARCSALPTPTSAGD